MAVLHKHPLIILLSQVLLLVGPPMILISPSSKSKLEVLDIGSLDLAIEKLSCLIWSLVDFP